MDQYYVSPKRVCAYAAKNDGFDGYIVVYGFGELNAYQVWLPKPVFESHYYAVGDGKGLPSNLSDDSVYYWFGLE